MAKATSTDLPRFGDAFKPPSRSALEREREERATGSSRLSRFALLAAARPKLKAMILLGVNCGYGNTDCSKLVVGKLDLGHGWANFARTKNGIRRRNPLWPETMEALRAVLKARKPPNDPSMPIGLHHEVRSAVSPSLSRPRVWETGVKAGMRREEADFYDLRRTCASIGVQVNDDDAVRTILGHKRPATDMLGVYNRLQVSDDRLRAVTDHIHDWLFTVAAATLAQESGDGQLLHSDQPDYMSVGLRPGAGAR